MASHVYLLIHVPVSAWPFFSIGVCLQLAAADSPQGLRRAMSTVSFTGNCKAVRDLLFLIARLFIIQLLSIIYLLFLNYLLFLIQLLCLIYLLFFIFVCVRRRERPSHGPNASSALHCAHRREARFWCFFGGPCRGLIFFFLKNKNAQLLVTIKNAV